MPLDSVVSAVIAKFEQRAAVGKQKYGTDLDRQDLKPLDWIQYAQEELMDGILYLEKLKQELSNHTNHIQTTIPQEASKPVVHAQKFEPPHRLDSVEDLKNLGGC